MAISTDEDINRRAAIEGSCLVLIAPLSGLARAGLSPILPKISEHFAGEPGADALVRLLVSSLIFAMIFGAIAGGILADRYGQRRILLFALAGYAISGCAGYFIDSLYLLLVSRLLLGIFVSAAGVVAVAMIATRLVHVRDRWIGFNHMAGTFGAIAILPLVGWLGGIDWRAVFLLYLLAVPVMVAILVVVPSTPPIAQSQDRKIGLISLNGIPFVILVLALLSGATGAISAIYIPFHLAEIGEGTPQRVAGALLPTAVAGGLAASIFGWVRARFSVRAIFIVGFLILAVGTLIPVVTGTYFGAVVGMTLYGVAHGFTGPNLIAATARAVPAERRAAALGLARAAGAAGPLVIQLLLEPISSAFGADAALLALAILSFALAAAFVVRRTLIPGVQ